MIRSSIHKILFCINGEQHTRRVKRWKPLKCVSSYTHNCFCFPFNLFIEYGRLIFYDPQSCVRMTFIVLWVATESRRHERGKGEVSETWSHKFFDELQLTQQWTKWFRFNGKFSTFLLFVIRHLLHDHDVSRLIFRGNRVVNKQQQFVHLIGWLDKLCAFTVDTRCTLYATHDKKQKLE